jgi:hypothetical protein
VVLLPRVLLLQGSTTGIQVVLEPELPDDAYQQLLAFDLATIRRGPLHYDRHRPAGLERSLLTGRRCWSIDDTPSEPGSQGVAAPTQVGHRNDDSGDLHPGVGDYLQTLRPSSQRRTVNELSARDTRHY